MLNGEHPERTVRVTSCQAPNSEYILLAVAQYLAAQLGQEEGRRSRIHIDPVQNLSWQERYDQLVDGGVQVAWICGAPYVRLRRQGTPLRLLAAPVWRAPRYEDRPVYFADLVVRSDNPAQSFADLRGAHLAINDRGSYSGYESLRAELAAWGEHRSYFGRVTEVGSHQASLQHVLDGSVDVASLDSTVLEEQIRRHPDIAERIRIVHSVGPAPMPPWVAAPTLDDELASMVSALLTEMHTTSEGRRVLAQTPVARFASVRDADYDLVRRHLDAAATVDL